MKCGKISQIVLVITGIAMMGYGAVRGEAAAVLGYRLPTPCIPYRLSRFSHSIISVSDSSYLCIPLNGRIDYLPRREKVQLDQCVAEGS